MKLVYLYAHWAYNVNNVSFLHHSHFDIKATVIKNWNDIIHSHIDT